jgi:hypothetical protein
MFNRYELEKHVFSFIRYFLKKLLELFYKFLKTFFCPKFYDFFIKKYLK